MKMSTMGTRTRSFLAPAAATIGLVVVFLMAVAPPAGAHRLDESYIYVDVYDTTVEGRLEFNVKELNEVLDLGLPTEDVEEADVAVNAARDDILAYAAPRFALGSGGTDWDLEYTEVEALETENGIFAIFNFDVAESFDTTPTIMDVRYEVFFDEVEDHVGLFHIGNYWEGGVFANETDSLNALSPFTISNTTETFDLEDPNFWRGLRGVVSLGVDHIRIGTDHILFIVALVLPSVLIFTSRGWQPASSFGASLWRVIKIATAFTVAHSITLSLAGLGIVELPSTFVEVIIALSIMLAALHNLRPLVVNREWVIAFGFGLFHGLGFAGLLSDLGLDRTNEVWSLLAFNVGVEIGQIAIILLLFPTLYVLRQTQLYYIGFRVASVIIAGVAFVWMLERIFDTDLGVNQFIDPFVEVPRAYLLAALAFAAACGWREIEKRRGTLRPPVEAPEEPEEAQPEMAGSGVGG